MANDNQSDSVSTPAPISTTVTVSMKRKASNTSTDPEAAVKLDITESDFVNTDKKRRLSRKNSKPALNNTKDPDGAMFSLIHSKTTKKIINNISDIIKLHFFNTDCSDRVFRELLGWDKYKDDVLKVAEYYEMEGIPKTKKLKSDEFSSLCLSLSVCIIATYSYN